MGKRYPEQVLTELSQGSAFFKRPANPPEPAASPSLESEQQQDQEPVKQTALPSARPVVLERSVQVPDVRTNERATKRRKTRHTFDIFSDQLLSLREIALRRETETGERVLLGELAQEALDMLITKERSKTSPDVRTNVDV